MINGYDDIALSLKKTKDVEDYLIKKKRDSGYLVPKNLLLLAGDGIGPEIMSEVKK